MKEIEVGDWVIIEQTEKNDRLIRENGIKPLKILQIFTIDSIRYVLFDKPEGRGPTVVPPIDALIKVNENGQPI